MNEFDLPAGHWTPAEHIADTRRDLDDTITAWRHRRTPASSEPVRIRRTQYRREEYATVDDDTVTTVEVWHHEDVAASTPEGYRLAADAALRALASTGTIDSHTRRRAT